MERSDKGGNEGTSNLDDPTFFDAIEGYTGALSYRPGDEVELHVSTRADSWSVTVERWGGQREIVHQADGLKGNYIEPPVDADENGCGWPVALTLPVAEKWRSGFYLVTLRADGVEPERAVAHAGFVVRGRPVATGERPSILYVVPTNTWNAYNNWGGRSLYTGGTSVAFHRPFVRGLLARPEVNRDDRKARPTRFGEAHDADGQRFQEYRTANNYPAAIGSTGWASHGRRFVEWAEQDGWMFDYAISSDLETDPEALAGYETVVLVGHDEYWSAPERAAVEQHLSRGGRLVSLAGNTMFWRVRRTAGTYGSTMVCYKYGHADDLGEADPHRPGPVTGMWADPTIGQPEWALLGAGSAFGLYHRFGKATPQGVGGFLVSRPDHWLFANTELRYGDVVGRDDGVVGYETVGCHLTLDELHRPVPSQDALARGVPASTEIVAWVPSSNVGVGEYPASISALSDQGDLEFIAERIFSDTDDPIGRARNGVATISTIGDSVVNVGTTDWVFGLANDHQVAQITRNALHGRPK